MKSHVLDSSKVHLGGVTIMLQLMLVSNMIVEMGEEHEEMVYKTTWSKNDINFVSISPTPPIDTEGVARDLQELSDYRRMERFRNVLQEHVMNDAHRYAFHRGLAAPNTLP